MHIIGRNVTVFDICTDYSQAATSLFTHSALEVSDAQMLTVLCSSTAAVTLYPQVSDDGNNWYDCKTEADGDLTFACSDEKVAAYLRVASRYFRVVSHNAGASAVTISLKVMIRT